MIVCKLRDCLVCPETVYGFDKLTREGEGERTCRRLQLRIEIVFQQDFQGLLHGTGMKDAGIMIRRSTYRIGGVGRRNPKSVQCGGHCLGVLEEIGVYGFAVCHPCVVREATLVNDAYLFEDCRFAGST